MDYCRYLVSDAHVRPTIVVEVDVAFNNPVGMLKRIEALLTVDTFHLYYTIDPFGVGIYSFKASGSKIQAKIQIVFILLGILLT